MRMIRFLVGDKVIHKSNPAVTWVVSAHDAAGDSFTCVTVLPVGNELVHSVIFGVDELDRGYP